MRDPVGPKRSAGFSAKFPRPCVRGTVYEAIRKRSSVRWNAIASCLFLSFFVASFSLPSSAQIAASPTALNFGNVPVGTRSTLTGVFTNADTDNVTISRVSVSGTNFTLSGMALPITLAPGQTARFSTTFAPSAAGAASGIIDVSAKTAMYKKHWRGTLRATVALTGTGGGTTPAGQLTANPASVAFGAVPLGTTSTQYQTLTNSGSADVSISQAAIPSPAFGMSGLSLPQTLTPGQSLTFSVTFTPQVSGTSGTNLTVTSTAANSNLQVPLSGSTTAVGQLAVTPGSLNFGSVIVGQSATQSGTLTATGARVTITSASPSTTEFVVNGLALPLTLNSGQSASYRVTFTPQASGTSSASLAFTSDATNPTVSEALAGVGTAAPVHSVDLSWNASSSTVAGYNVYRGNQSAGPFTKLNTSLDASTSYTDTSVQGGKTYYYVATSVDGGGTESGYSSAVSVVIPTP